MAEDSIMVTVRCLAFNHVKYIRQCLNGFIMQKTNFDFEVVVHDDASSDGTAEIIKEYADKYPRLIKPILEEENQYSKGGNILHNIMNSHTRGKYIAFCEGDDYWTDPLKLQKQVDILEQHPEYSMVYTGFQTVDEEGKAILRPDYERYMRVSFTGDIFPYLLRYGNFVLTVSICLRKEHYMGAIRENSPCFLDFNTVIASCANSMAYYLPEKTCCYRQSPNGMMMTQGKEVSRKTQKIRKYIVGLYLDGKIQKRGFLRHNIIKIDLLVFAFHLYKNGADKDYIKWIFKRDSSFLLIAPIAIIVGVIRKMK